MIVISLTNRMWIEKKANPTRTHQFDKSATKNFKPCHLNAFCNVPWHAYRSFSGSHHLNCKRQQNIQPIGVFIAIYILILFYFINSVCVESHKIFASNAAFYQNYMDALWLLIRSVDNLSATFSFYSYSMCCCTQCFILSQYFVF